MAWMKVDDGFWSHPKVISLSTDAVALWVRAGSYCARHLTDGAIPATVVMLLGGSQAVANELVKAGLWDGKGDGYAFHDWDHYQLSSAETKDRRLETSRKRAEAGRKGAAARWRGNDGKADGNLPMASDGNDMAPSRPVPSSSSKEEDHVESPSTEIAISTRPDVEALLDLLDEKLRENDVRKLPRRNKANLDAMRLMLDRDKREPSEIASIIVWCQQSDFWKANVMSATKLREKYEQLRLQMNSRPNPKGALPPNQARAISLVQQYREQEQHHAEITDG